MEVKVFLFPELNKPDNYPSLEHYYTAREQLNKFQLDLKAYKLDRLVREVADKIAKPNLIAEHNLTSYPLDIPYFGKDKPNDRPDEAVYSDIWHIHIATTSTELNHKNWRNKAQEFRTSDRFIIYCRGLFNQNYFCILAVEDPPAHDKLNDAIIQSNMIAAARRFREKY